MRKTAIELLFDADLESEVDRILRAIRDAGLPSPLLDWKVRPHVSLLLGADARAGLDDAVGEFAAATRALPVTLDCVGSFPGDQGVVYLAPVVDRALLDLHAAAHDALREHLGATDPLYRPGRWMPHCTVSVGLDEGQVAEAIQVCRRAPLPLTGRLARVAIHDVETDPDREGRDRVVSTRQRATRPLGAT